MEGAAQPRAYIVNMNETGPKVRVPIRGARFTIGKHVENDLCLEGDRAVSRRHCIIHDEGDRLCLEDCLSRNGTYLDGRRITGRAPMRLPCWIGLGSIRLAVLPSDSAEDEGADSIETISYTKGNVIVPSGEGFDEREDALLLVDVVNSLKILRRSEMELARLIAGLGQLLRQALAGHRGAYLECTGDGFFACFDTAEAALRTATRLGPTLRRDLAPVRFQLSTALHWGPSKRSAHGNRVGKSVYSLFSLQDLRRRGRTKLKRLLPPSGADLILLTEPFYHALGRRAGLEAKELGAFRLEGATEELKVFRCSSPALTTSDPAEGV